MEAPGPRIHIQQLVLTISWITLELNLDKSVELDSAQKPLGQFFNFWRIGGLDVTCRSAKFARMLAEALGDKSAVYGTVPEKSAIGELAVAIPRNDFLDQDLARIDIPGSCIEKRIQLLRSFRPPCFRPGRVEEVFLDRRLNRER